MDTCWDFYSTLPQICASCFSPHDCKLLLWITNVGKSICPAQNFLVENSQFHPHFWGLNLILKTQLNRKAPSCFHGTLFGNLVVFGFLWGPERIDGRCVCLCVCVFCVCICTCVYVYICVICTYICIFRSVCILYNKSPWTPPQKNVKYIYIQ